MTTVRPLTRGPDRARLAARGAAVGFTSEVPTAMVPAHASTLSRSASTLVMTV